MNVHAPLLPALLLAGTACATPEPRPAAQPAPAEPARAEIRDAAGAVVGNAILTDTPHGVLIAVTFQGLPPGPHAFHIHEVGRCEPPFTSAGGHFAPRGHAHGFLVPEGPHAGDLPNIHVPEHGPLRLEVLASGTSLRGPEAALLDADGAALVVHAGADDYRSQPAGGAGNRIACGVITG